MRSLASWFPVRCAFCGRPHPLETVCRQCWSKLPWNRVFCERCGQPLPLQQSDGTVCASCQKRPPPYRVARAAFCYSFPVDSAIKALKFRRQLDIAPALATLLLPLLSEHFGRCDALLPVPLHRWRQTRRGFNQAMEICRGLRRHTGRRIVTDVRRVRATSPQSGLSAVARRKNLRDAFSVPELLTCRRPLIVDDVITTGATIAQLASTLLRAGADQVDVLAVARVDQFKSSRPPGSPAL